LAGSNSSLAQKGSVLVTMAILVPVFILLAGFITDIGRALVYRADLNKACMVAAEEAAKCIDMQIAMDQGRTVLGDFEDVVILYFENNLERSRSLKVVSLDYEVIESAENPRFIKVYSEGDISCYFLRLIGIDTIRIRSSANGRVRKIK